MKLFPVNWANAKIPDETGYPNSRRIVEFVTLADNLLSSINCPQPVDFLMLVILYEHFGINVNV